MMAREPHILWVHQNFVGPGQAGNRRGLQVARALAGAGFAVHVVTSQSSYMEDGGGARAASAVRGRLHLHRLGAAHSDDLEHRGRSYARFARAAARFVRSLPAPDLVFASTPPLPQVALSIALAARHRCPLVLEVRDLWPAFLYEVGVLRSGATRLGLEWLESFAYHAADSVLVVAPAFAPYLRAMGVAPQRVHVVPSAMDPDIANAPDDRLEWRQRHRLEGARVIAYAGSFNEAYDLDAALDVAAEVARTHPNVAWVFAGNGRRRPEFEARLARSPWLRDLGCLPKEEILPLYGIAEAGIVTLRASPILNTVVPGKLLDCFAAALPVLCFASGQPARCIEMAAAGIQLGQLSLEARVAAVLAFLNLPPAERDALGARGRTWGARYFHEQQLTQRIAGIFRDALALRPRQGRVPIAIARAANDMVSLRSRRTLRRLFIDEADGTLDQSWRDWPATGHAIDRV